MIKYVNWICFFCLWIFAITSCENQRSEKNMLAKTKAFFENQTASLKNSTLLQKITDFKQQNNDVEEKTDSENQDSEADEKVDFKPLNEKEILNIQGNLLINYYKKYNNAEIFIRQFQSKLVSVLIAIKTLSSGMVKREEYNKTDKALQITNTVKELVEGTVFGIPIAKIILGISETIKYKHNKIQKDRFESISFKVPLSEDVDKLVKKISFILGDKYDYYLTKIETKDQAKTLAKFVADALICWLLKFDFDEDKSLEEQFISQIGIRKETIGNYLQTIKRQFGQEITENINNTTLKFFKRFTRNKEFFKIVKIKDQRINLKNGDSILTWDIYQTPKSLDNNDPNRFPTYDFAKNVILNNEISSNSFNQQSSNSLNNLNNNYDSLEDAYNANDISAMIKLIKCGADPNRFPRFETFTFLHQACIEDKYNIAKALLENGADVNKKDDGRGYTPLHWAVLHGHTRIKELLIKHGATIL